MGYRLAGLILAAGESKRFGSAKQLAEINGETLIARAHRIVSSVTGAKTFVVLGARADRIQQSLPDAICFIHPDWDQGLGSSIAFGIKQLLNQAGAPPDGILITLADQVAVTSDELSHLTRSFDGQAICAARYRGKNGVPALFPARYFQALSHLEGDTGAKAILNATDQKTIAYDMPSAAQDIDTVEQFLSFKTITLDNRN